VTDFKSLNAAKPQPRQEEHTEKVGQGTAVERLLLARPELVFAEGCLTIPITSGAPYDAMREDLLLLRSAIDGAGIEFLLTRGNDDCPVISVEWAAREELQSALARAFAEEPFYSVPIDVEAGVPTLLASEDLAIDPEVRAFSLFRPRIAAERGLRYGASTGVRLEFWTTTEKAIFAPAEGSIMRRELWREDITLTTIELHERSWPTFEGMFELQVSDVDFNIDLVFSWVDGDDLEWQRARAQKMKRHVVGHGDDSPARFRQLDELRYAMRSVNLFAPWVRNIFIVTDSPRPKWLADHPRVEVVNSSQFFADTTALPTYNSHAIETQLHNIPGLSEHFIYSNDDMFFGRPVPPELFFTPGGITKFAEATWRIGLGDSHVGRSGFANAARNNRRLIQEHFGRTITRHLQHAPVPLRKSVMKDLEAEFPEDIRRTAASMFRSLTDVSVTNSLYHYYALLTGRAVAQTDARVRYIDTTKQASLSEMEQLLALQDVDFFCLNDGSFPEVSPEERAQRIRSFLESYLPIVAPWEVSYAPD
jgi:hypothetical protein